MSILTLFADRLCQTLLHSLWQTLAIVIVVSIVARLVQRRAEIAYAVSMAGLVAAVVCMPVTFALVSPAFSQLDGINMAGVDTAGEVVVANDSATIPSPTIAAGSSGAATNATAEDAADNRAGTPAAAIRSDKSATRTADTATVSAAMTSDQQQAEPKSAFAQFAAVVAPWIAVAYAMGVVMMFIRLCMATINAGRLVRSASALQDDGLIHVVRSITQRWNMRIAPVVAVTQQVVVPQIVGLIRPVILLPASALTGLGSEELMLVLAHEIAHLRRFDLWAAMVQRFAETVLFFNPAMWFLSRRVSELREFCCDELVCHSAASSQKNVRLRYAEALLHVASLSLESGAGESRIDGPNLTALAASGRSPSELRRRISRMLNEPVSEPFPTGRGLLVAFGAGLICMLLPGLLPTIADEPKPGAATATQREFHLQVNGPDGKPVPNAVCEIRNIPRIAAADVLIGRHERDHQHGTVLLASENGELRFRRPANANSLQVTVKQPGYGPYCGQWDSSQGTSAIPDSFTMELDAAWTVAGRIVDEAGSAVAGANVSLSIEFRKPPGDESQFGVGAEIKSDAEGNWRYEMVPASKDYVFVSIDHPSYSANRLPLKRTDFEAKPDTPPKSITLTKGLSVTGTVTDDTGKPIENAMIRTMHANEIREAKTDNDGKYTLNGCEPKLSRIVCIAPGKARELKEALIDPSMAPVDFTMMPGRHVRVRVLDENGKGVPRSRIFFQQWRGGHPRYGLEFFGVNEYTNDDGVWEWNEAPVDEFEADICRADGMQMPSQPIIAREEEYVFRPPRLLVVSGKVTDKETGELIKNFRCVPGGRSEPHQKPENWHLDETYKATAGTYTIERGNDIKAHMVRIEADGYKVAVSRDIASNEGNVELNFELVRAADIVITLQTPDGKPAADAEVALGLRDEQIHVRNGQFTRSTYAARLKADASGVLRMPFRDQSFEVYVLHPSGYAQISSQDNAISELVTLNAWASVSGVLHSGNKPAAEVDVQLYSSGNLTSELCSVSCYSNSQADANGEFTIPCVFPGTGRIGREITYMVRDGATEVTSSQELTATYIAGETTTIEIGRGGRPVTGRLVLPEDYKQAIVWRQLCLDVAADIPEPIPIGLDQNDPNAFAKWQQTREARDYEVAMHAFQSRKDAQPVFRASVDRDGSFRIDNVPSGEFVLSEWSALQDWKLSMTPRSFEVPEINGDYEDTVLDLGEIELVPE